MYKFADKFYREIYSAEDFYHYDWFKKYPNDFVSRDAASYIDNDIALSFAEFVVRDRQTGSSIAEQKINFFYDYPELCKIRDELRAIRGE